MDNDVSWYMALDTKNCPWMKFAEQELGVHRTHQRRGGNPEIIKYLSVVGLGNESTPWCSAFANWCMTQAGIQGTKKANARSWLQWGTSIVDSRFGAVTVFSRGGKGDHVHGHVAFFVANQGQHVIVLGGNQTSESKVCFRSFPRTHVLGMRWPSAS